VSGREKSGGEELGSSELAGKLTGVRRRPRQGGDDGEQPWGSRVRLNGEGQREGGGD
jgi:hypothetical protein